MSEHETAPPDELKHSEGLVSTPLTDTAPLNARRVDLELYLRWMQNERRFKPSTVSRRLSVVAGFYQTCVIDGLLEHSPAEHVRRPRVPSESPTLGLSHLQFEALLSAAHDSQNPNDLALVTMPGLLGLRIFEATGADIEDLSEVYGHRVRARQRRQSRVDARRHFRPPWLEPLIGPEASETPDRSCEVAPRHV